MIPADFKGVKLDDLVVLEQLLSLNMYVYDLQETEAGSIGCTNKVHGIHLLKQRQLCSSKYSLEGRLWHQWDVGSTCLGRRSHWSADERPTWYRVLSRDSAVPVQTADHSLQDQPVFWFYPTEHRDWSVAVLPFSLEQRQIS
jgi:hypothetical protein